MDLAKTIPVTLLALLPEEDQARRLGPILWTIFAEIEAFFRPAEASGTISIPIGGPPGSSSSASSVATVGAVFSRRFLSNARPPDEIGAGPDEVVGLPPDFDQRMLQGASGTGSSSQPLSSWGEFQSRMPTSAAVGARPVDARLIGAAVHDIAKPSSWTLIVSDLELAPPPSWRYVVWDVIPSGAVVSLAPVDPKYWSEPVQDETHRHQVIKSRTRAACISVVGSLLGLQRCENPTCFMYSNVDSVVRLDDMIHLGPEHGVTELAGRGFDVGGDPRQAASIRTISARTA